MDHSNPFRETKSISSSPFQTTLSWNAKKGVWYGRNENGTGVKMKNLWYFMIEPMLFMVTGRDNKSGLRFWSNLCCYREGFKELTVKCNDGYRTQVLAKGNWRDIKPGLPKGPAWTKVNAVLLVMADCSVEDEDGNWGEWKAIKPNSLTQLRMRGRAIASTRSGDLLGGWGGFRESVDVTEENLAGFLMQQLDVIEVKGNTHDPDAVNFYPVFTGRPMDTSQEKDARMLLLAKPLFNKVEEYLLLEKENTEGKSAGYVENQGSNETPMPTAEDEPVSGVSDDDVPF